MVNFGERLKDLMQDNNLTLVKLQELCGCSKTSISSWIRHNIYPKLPNLIKLADYFNCSTDYLLGLTDISDVTLGKSSSSFIDRLNFLVEKKDITYYRLSKDCNILEHYFSRWKTGLNPRMDYVIIIANYFGCTVDYIIGRTNIY